AVPPRGRREVQHSPRCAARGDARRGDRRGHCFPPSDSSEDIVVLVAPGNSHLTTARSPAQLVSIARDLAVDRDRWLTRVVHRPDARWFERVVLADDHDVWLIGWDSFQGVDFHDHGDAAGVLYVVDGALV